MDSALSTFLQEPVKRADDSGGHRQDNPCQWTVYPSMNHREPPHASAAGRKAVHCLASALLCAVTLPGVHAISHRPVITFAARVPESVPYLPINGAPPLRFAEAPPPKPVEPVAGPSASSTTSPATETTNSSSTSATDGNASIETTTAAVTKDPAPAKTPAPILADEARPMVRAEDFLPYFQIPSSARRPGDVMLVTPGIPTPPSAGPMPPSSATYTQTPK